MKNLFLLFFIVMLSACSHLGQKFDTVQSPSDEEALIYYYRPNNFFGSGVYYDIRENKDTITTLYNGGYYPHFTTPGEKTIEAQTESTSYVSFNAEKGKTYFVRGKVNMGFLMGRPSLRVVPQEKALQEIQECRMIKE